MVSVEVELFDPAVFSERRSSVQALEKGDTAREYKMMYIVIPCRIGSYVYDNVHPKQLFEITYLNKGVKPLVGKSHKSRVVGFVYQSRRNCLGFQLGLGNACTAILLYTAT
jgi:hypothetical protein